MGPSCEHSNREKTGIVFYVDPMLEEWVCFDCGAKWAEEDPESKINFERRLGIREPPLYPRVDANLVCSGCGLVLSQCHKVGCRSKPPKE